MSQIPFSNPAGNNQMTPKAPTPGGIPAPGGPVGVHDNPYAPVTGHPLPVTGGPTHHGGVQPMAAGNTVIGAAGAGAPNIPTAQGQGGPGQQSGSQNGFITNASSYSNGQNDLSKQLTDIYGKGVGGSLFNLLQSMSGTDSKILQEYIASLQPQMAKAQADTNAALGAGGVSANSSVAAIADSNLQAQEFAAISGESASLTRSQEQLTAQLLSGMSGDAEKEVASNGWGTFANVLNGVAQDAASLISAWKGGSPKASNSNSNSIPASSLDSANYNSGNVEISELSAGQSAGASEEPFAVGDSN